MYEYVYYDCILLYTFEMSQTTIIPGRFEDSFWNRFSRPQGMFFARIYFALTMQNRCN